MDEWLEYVDEVDRVHQRRVEWVGTVAAAADERSGNVYGSTEEF